MAVISCSPAAQPVAQYLRVSTDQQKYSIEQQSEAIQAYARRHGFLIVKTYKDSGRSGVLLKDRPELTRLLNDVIGGNAQFKAILVYDVSRWGRFQDCDEAAHYEFLCKSAHVPIHYCAECFLNDHSLPNTIIKAIKRSMAAEYSREMGMRVFAGCERIAGLGFKQGGAPGYGLRRCLISADGQRKQVLTTGETKGVRTDRVVLVPGPDEEVECIREIYRLVVEERMRPNRIAKELNRRGVKLATGPWRQGMVSRILTDPKYAGSNVWNRSSGKLRSSRIQKPKSDWLIRPGAFAPVIDPVLFEKAQIMLLAQKTPYSKQVLLEILQNQLHQTGELSYRTLKNCRDLPSMTTLIKHFGSVRQAFAMAGQKQRGTMPTSDEMQLAKSFRDLLLKRIIFTCPREVALVHFGPDSPTCLEIDHEILVSVLVCPAIRRNHTINWYVDHADPQGGAIVFLARLNGDNTQALDHYVLRHLRMRWIRRPFELGCCKQILNLSEFCQAARGVSLQSREKLS
jgi:DNA invertase Pin-like site-specific DNA recombinase